MTLEIDLFQDWKDILKGDLESYGYNLSNTDDKDIPILYYNVKNRHIEEKPRTVKISKEFRCPRELEKGWRFLKRHVESGYHLNAHLSKKVKKLNRKDALLDNWGVYHFHLGEKMKGEFVEQGDPLVFAVVREHVFYAIGIFKHGDWAKREIAEIIHHNWSYIIKDYKIEGMDGDSCSDQEIINSNKDSLNIFIEVNDGTVYAPMGGGRSLSGYNAKASTFGTGVNRVIEDLEVNIKDQLKDKTYNFEMYAKLHRINDRYIIRFNSYDYNCHINIPDVDIHENIMSV